MYHRALKLHVKLGRFGANALWVPTPTTGRNTDLPSGLTPTNIRDSDQPTSVYGSLMLVGVNPESAPGWESTAVGVPWSVANPSDPNANTEHHLT